MGWKMGDEQVREQRRFEAASALMPWFLQWHDDEGSVWDVHMKDAAEEAVRAADALLKALEDGK